MAMLRLLCYLRGDDRSNAFVVNIDEDEFVADLRKAIKERKSPKFNDIPANSLTLWKASVPYSLNLKKEVEALNLVDDDSLHPPDILSEIFSSGLKSNSVHIIIDRPHSVKATNFAMLKLFCYVLGEGCNNTFAVNIKEDETIGDLREAIKEEKRPKFDDILADSLTLWKASVPYSLNLKKEVEALNLVDDDSLQSLWILSDIFSSGLDGDHVHIIVDRPRSVKTTDSAMLKLFCYVLGEGCNNTFVVNIKEDETVADLKKAIKEKKSPKFNDILADSLTLWKASVPYSLNLKKEVEALNLVDDDSLQRLRILSDIFSSGLDRSHVHIIVDRPRSGRRSGLPSANPTRQHEKSATEKAWKMTFQGTGAKLFRTGLDDMNKSRSDKLYANFVSIIQSSGLGKSRLADEVAKLIFTIPFCFRTELNGYPEADEAPRGFFGLRFGETFNTVFDRFLLFLEKLFIAVRREVQENFPKQVDTPLPDLWYNHLLQDRERIYEKVVTTTENSIKAKRTPHYPTSRTAGSNALKEDQRPVYIAAKALIDVINSYTKEDESEEESRPVRLIIYIDESHEMTTSEETIKGDGRNAYQVLCSCLNELRNLDLFFVFISTSNFMLSDYSPSSRVFWSTMGQNSSITHVQTPYTELPFDVWKEPHLVTEGIHTMDDVCSVEFMVRFGRPLWWTRWEAGDAVVKDKLIEFAMMKLAAQSSNRKYTWESFLAATSVRLTLDFEPRRISAVETENLMVAGHLRVANVIPSHREYMISSTPSEPIVAEAAAQVLLEQNMISILCRNVRDGLIEKGQRGELAARLLLTLAHDAALEKMDVKRRSYQGQLERLFTTPVPLLAFLSALFAQPLMEDIMKAVPDNQSTGPTLKESFKDAYVMFTHFGKAADEWCISDKFAFMALTRNMAIACRERMEFVDLCIPVHFGEKNPLSRNTTSAIFISIKDKEKVMGYNRTHIDVSKLKFFTDETKPRPVINLILQLGVQSAGRYTTIQRTNKQKKPGLFGIPERKSCDGQVPQTPIDVFVLRAKNNDTTKTKSEGTAPGPPCYTINARGCSSRIYGVVKPNEEPLWDGLLASRDFLSEHGRQATDHLKAVMAQKPIWTSGPECCGWADMGEEPSQVLEEEAEVSEAIILGTDPSLDDADVFQ